MSEETRFLLARDDYIPYVSAEVVRVVEPFEIVLYTDQNEQPISKKIASELSKSQFDGEKIVQAERSAAEKSKISGLQYSQRVNASLAAANQVNDFYSNSLSTTTIKQPQPFEKFKEPVSSTFISGEYTIPEYESMYDAKDKPYQFTEYKSMYDP